MSALAKLQIARKELHLHDDDYRAILERVTGQRSAKGMAEAEIIRVLDVLMRDHGWVPTVVKGGKKGTPAAKVKPAEHPTALKARALWISLWQLGVVRNRTEAALEAFAKRQLQCERLVWADQQQMYKLIEALKAMAQRAEWDQDVRGIAVADRVGTLLRRLIIRQSAILSRPAPEDLFFMSTDSLSRMAAKLAPSVRKFVGAD